MVYAQHLKCCEVFPHAGSTPALGTKFMAILFWIILTTFLLSIVSLAGAVVLAFREKTLHKIVGFLVDLSIGVLLAVAFFDLIPETIEKFGADNIFLYVLSGFFLFFLIEKILHWRHCHEEHCPVHAFAYMNLLGEAVHNFTDGLIIGASFVIDFNLGMATVLAVVLHEIPHEIGNFGVLVYAGFQKAKALWFNFLIGLTAVLGGIIGYYLSHSVGVTAKFLLPFAAGGFIYIAASDLIPEGKKHTSAWRSLLSFVFALLGVALIYFIVFFAEK